MLIEFQKRRLLILGFGSIAATVLPMIIETLDIAREQILIVSTDDRYAHVRERLGVEHRTVRLTKENHREVLAGLVEPGDFLLNLTGGVSSRRLVIYCLEHGIDYLDTSNERWEHGAVEHDSADYAEQWNLLMSHREDLPKSATALVGHGANPGIVSHFAKQAVEDLARAEGVAPEGEPGDWHWGRLARELGIEALHISERDTQEPERHPGPGVACCTWSVEGLLEESLISPCFAWGSHEPAVPGASRRRDPVCDVAMLPGPAKSCIVESWLPSTGVYHGAAIPHEETFSIAELFSEEGPQGRYQPTVLFAYWPCDLALEALEKGEAAKRLAPRVLIEEMAQGMDELGVLVLRKGSDGVYWYGSVLEVGAARQIVEFTNATSLQVAAGVLGGLVWALENPRQGLVSAENADHRRVLEVARPWLGDLVGVHSRWQDAPESWTMAALLAEGVEALPAQTTREPMARRAAG